MNGPDASDSPSSPPSPGDQPSTTSPLETTSVQDAAPASSKLGCAWRVLTRVICAFYILGASVLSVLVVSFVPRIGGPIAPHLPKDAMALLHVRDGNEIWRLLESDAGLQDVWEDVELQRRTNWRLDLDRARDELASNPVTRNLLSLDREGLQFVLGGEAALAILPRPPTDKFDDDPAQKRKLKPETVLFIRLQGARGALVRMVAALFSRKWKAKWNDLGSGLIAIGSKGARLAGGSGDADEQRSTDVGRTLARLTLNPHALRLATAGQILSLGGISNQTPRWFQVFGAKGYPDEVAVEFRPSQSGGIMVVGTWRGPLPEVEAPAPMIGTGQTPDQQPVFEARVPLSARAAFLRYLDSQLNSGSDRRRDKNRRRWESRMLRLAEANVDLEKDLWPFTGKTLRLRIVPPPEGSATGQPLVLASLPLKPTSDTRTALTELFRVRWKGLYEGRVPGKAKRPYVKLKRTGKTESYMLVKGSFTRTMWLVNEECISLVSDAVPLMLMPRLAKEKPTGEKGAVFVLRSNGMQLAPHVGALTQMFLEDWRDDIGAAEFVDEVPDEDAVVRLAATISRASGRITCLLIAQPDRTRSNHGTIVGSWEPQSNH